MSKITIFVYPSCV